MEKKIHSAKMGYKKRLEFCYVCSLLLLLTLFTFSKHVDKQAAVKEVHLEPLKAIDVPRTVQPPAQKRPERPPIIIESEDEDIPENFTIESTEINYAAIDLPQAPQFEDENLDPGKFVPYEKPPEIIGGRAELMKHLKYPEIARKAGIEGTVIVYALVSKKGKVLKTKILKSLGNNGCDEAAIHAVSSVKWRPAYQRDKPVTVWVSVQVGFKLI